LFTQLDGAVVAAAAAVFITIRPVTCGAIVAVNPFRFIFGKELI
jgi:hypothetical protein